jgi:2-desacetyl-2-hydroxyethyl bacteriochlorophyllide A dehydrogenase
MMKGTAVVFTDRLKVAYQEVEIPEPGPQDVVIDVEYSWISIGTESSFLRGERITGEQSYRETDPWPFPHVAGYQKVGTVRSVGAEVQGLQPGDRVFATVSQVSGMFYSFGGHINPSVTHFSQVWKLPSGKPPIDYSGMVLTQVGYNCGSRAPVRPGDHAVVIGDGLVGQWAAQTLLHRGAIVTVLGRHDERLRYLPEAVTGVNTRRTSVAEAMEGGKEVRIVVDSVGAMETVQQLRRFMVRDSHWVSAGFLGTNGWVDIQSLREQEITLYTPSGWSKERMDRTLQGITEGWLQTGPLITHRFKAEQAEAAWNLILENKELCLGVILEWQ